MPCYFSTAAAIFDLIPRDEVYSLCKAASLRDSNDGVINTHKKNKKKTGGLVNVSGLHAVVNFVA